jgi:hypothetical protein
MVKGSSYEGIAMRSGRQLGEVRKADLKTLFRKAEQKKIGMILGRTESLVLAQPDLARLAKFRKDKELRQKLEFIFIETAKAKSACNPLQLKKPLG